MSRDAIKMLFGVLLALTLFAVAGAILTGCTEEDTYYRSVTAPCCDDGCTTEAHDDPCHPDCLTGNNFTICFNGKTMKVPKDEWQSYKDRGAVKGKCPRGDDDDDDGDDDDDDGDDDDDDDECDPSVECCVVDGKTFICHFPPGNPGNYHTLHIGSSAVPAHLSNHPGDHCGYCLDPEPCFWCN